MKKLFALFAILFASTAFAADQQPPKPQAACSAEIPYGMPTMVAKNPVICRNAYILMHDPEAKIPRWVAWTLTPSHVIGCVARTNDFAADASLPKDQRSDPKDYAGSGYDQGHLANNADMSFDAQVEHESFYMSNMSPQLPSVNRGVWKNLESAERAWVYSTQHSFTIYAGNVWSKGSKTIGADKVVVPDYLYKILIDDTTKKSYAFIIKNSDGNDQDFSKYQTSVSKVEELTKLSFPVPDSKADVNKILPVDLKSYSDKKKSVCKGQ